MQRLRERLIDDARRGGQNAQARFAETIYTTNVDFLGEVLGTWVREIAWEYSGLGPDAPLNTVLSSIPAWFLPVIGIDDLPDAYKGIPLSEADSRAAVVAVYDPTNSEWKFAVSRSMLFGLSPAVIHFNRKPTLLVAALRRLFGVASAAFFDDVLAFGLACGEGSENKAVRRLFGACGSPPSPSKHAPMASIRTWIGIVVNVGAVAHDGSYTIQPTHSSVKAVVEGCRQAIESGELSTGEAASLRGRVGWAASAAAGRCGRIGLAVLKRKQYQGPASLSASDKNSLQFLATVAQNLPCRRVTVAGAPSRLVRVYSDASAEPGNLPRLGWVTFSMDGSGTGCTHQVSQKVMDSLVPRSQQIFPAEALAVYAAILHQAPLLQDTDALFSVIMKQLLQQRCGAPRLRTMSHR